MSTPSEPSGPGTVADLAAYWSGVREHGPQSPATATAYLGAIARILHRQGVAASATLDELDLPALTASFAAAQPDLQPRSLASITGHLNAAINGYHARHRPGLSAPTASPFTPPATEAGGASSAPQEPDEHKGTHEQARAQEPHLASRPAAQADPQVITKEFTGRHPGLSLGAIASYGPRLTKAIAAYTAYLADPHTIAPPAPARGPRPAPARTTEIQLPGARVVSLRTPPDLTDEESAATGAMLRLHHPRMFAPIPPAAHVHPSADAAWTLVFWPEHAPDEPETAHLSGTTFRGALAEYIRTRCPDLARFDDDDVIDEWFSTEVFVALAIDGHHTARDAGTLV